MKVYFGCGPIEFPSPTFIERKMFSTLCKIGNASAWIFLLFPKGFEEAPSILQRSD